MKLVLDQPCIEPFNPANDIKVLIACADAAAAEQARGVLESIGRSCGTEGRLICDWWNFEVLAIGSLKAFASREAAAANLVVIVARQAGQLSQDVADWVSGWVNFRKDEHGALAVMLNEGTKDEGTSPVLSQLRKFAAIGRMDFFCWNHPHECRSLTESVARLRL